MRQIERGELDRKILWTICRIPPWPSDYTVGAWWVLSSLPDVRQVETTWKEEVKMRKLRLIEHMSLDGVIQTSSGPGDDGDFPYGDWTAPYRSPAGLASVLPEWGERFDVLIGRRTYDQWVGFWPKAPQSPMADRLNAATKYVVTHRPQSLEWGPVESIGQDLVEGVRRIKAQDGPDLIVSGSSTLTSALIEHGLADPAGQGQTPVCGGNSATRIRLREHESYADGHRRHQVQIRWNFAEPEIRIASVFPDGGDTQTTWLTPIDS
jgi:dihydrofolate reductase